MPNSRALIMIVTYGMLAISSLLLLMETLSKIHNHWSPVHGHIVFSFCGVTYVITFAVFNFPTYFIPLFVAIITNCFSK